MFGRKQLTSVYIVDDNSDAIEVLRRMLESQYSVKVIGTSTDADTAIEEIIQLAPELIFTDVEMPTMTGIQLCQLLHQEVDPNTKVVFYTGHDKYMIDAIRQKAFDYLLKPPSPQDLAQTMTRFYEDKLASLPQAAGPAEQRQPRILVVNAMNEHIALRDADVAFFRFDADGKHRLHQRQHLHPAQPHQQRLHPALFAIVCANPQAIYRQREPHHDDTRQHLHTGLSLRRQPRAQGEQELPPRPDGCLLYLII